MKQPGRRMKKNCEAQKERGAFNSPANHGKANISPRSNENSFKTGKGRGTSPRTEENAFQHGKRAKTGKAWRKGK